MSQVNTVAVAKGAVKGSTKAARAKANAKPALNADTVASQLALHAGTVWQGRMSFGLAIVASDNAGVKREELLAAIKALPTADQDKVLDTLGKGSLDDLKVFNPNASRIANAAKVFAHGLKSPDGKHAVTAEQVAAWRLSKEDAALLARRLIPNKDGKTAINVSTLKGYCDKPDGGREAVRKAVDSLKPQRGGASSNGKPIKGIAPDVFRQFETALKAAKAEYGIDVSTFLRDLMADATKYRESQK